MNEEEGITGSERFRVFSRDDEGNHFNPIIRSTSEGVKFINNCMEDSDIIIPTRRTILTPSKYDRVIEDEGNLRVLPTGSGIVKLGTGGTKVITVRSVSGEKNGSKKMFDLSKRNRK